MTRTARKALATTLEGDVETERVIAFQRASWVVERAGWTVMGFVLLAGLFGLFGGSPLWTRTAEGEGLAVRYPVFARRTAPATLEVRIERPPGEARVALATAYLERVRVEQVTPPPLRVVASPEWMAFVFAADGGPIRVAFEVQPQEYGIFEGRLRLDDGPPLRFRQVVYP